MKEKIDLKMLFDLKRGRLPAELEEKVLAELEASPVLRQEFAEITPVFETLEDIHKAPAEAGAGFTQKVMEEVKRSNVVNEGRFGMFAAVSQIIRSKWLVIGLPAMAALVLCIYWGGTPDHHALTGQATVALNFPVDEPGSFNDERIAGALSRLLTLLEGSFGALIMVAGLLGAICFAAARRFKVSAVLAMVCVASFVGRSTMSTFFNTQSLDNLSVEMDSARLAQPASVTIDTNLKNFAPQPRAGKAAGSTVPPSNYQERTAEIFKKIPARSAKSVSRVEDPGTFNDERIDSLGERLKRWVTVDASPDSRESFKVDASPGTTAYNSAVRIDKLAPAIVDIQGERYGDSGENQRTETNANPVSTFSLDVDTGSYSNARRFLRQGQLPPPQSVRIEEYLNYFDYNYPPERSKPFAVNYEIAPSPLSSGRYLLKLGVSTRDAGLNPELGWNLVFLIDSSGSMADTNKLPLIKQALHLLIDRMRPIDRIGIVTYSDTAMIALDSTPGSQKSRINSVVDSLVASGGTNGAAGIDMAYQVAEAHRIPGSVNRIVLATDGDFNVGRYSFDELSRLVENRRRGGIGLTTLGFGELNINEANMEQLADRGNGNYFYIDSFEEARKVLDNGLVANMTTVAKDVKLQVEFNPANVLEYRLIGFDNRQLRREDFTNDRIDAGDLGSGHTVTALYEVTLSDSPLAKERNAALRYQASAPARNEKSEVTSEHAPELGFVKIRYKEPEGASSTEVSFPMLKANIKRNSEETSEDFRFAAAVAGFGQVLRNSQFVEDYTLNDVLKLAEQSRGRDPYGYRAEFERMVRDAAAISRPLP